MKLEKGFYVIGRDLDLSKSFIFGENPQCFKTFEDALKKDEEIRLENLNNNIETIILEVGSWQ